MKDVDAAQSTLSLRLFHLKNMHSKLLLWMLVAVSGLGALVAVIMRGAAVEWFILSLCLITYGLCYIAPKLAIQNIEVKRSSMNDYQNRANYAFNIDIYRKWRIPGIWYASVEYIVNESEIDGEVIELKQHYDPLFHRRMTQRFVVNQLSRGHYTSKYVLILVGDIFGLTTLRKIVEVPLSFTVFPNQLAEQDHTYLTQVTSKKWTEKALTSNKKGSNETYDNDNQHLDTSAFGHIEGVKPYSEGDSIHRIYYHALSRGMGVHVLEEKEQLNLLKHIIFIDQYMPPMEAMTQVDHFNTLIGWVIDRVTTTLKNGPVLVVTDNWCYELYELYQLDELRRLLAHIRADVQYPISERLLSLAKILPSHSQLTVYTTDWKNSEGWTELAQLAWHKKVTVSLQFLTEHRIMTYAMREQQRELEQNGLQTTWRFSNFKAETYQLAREGSEVYVYD